MHEGPPKTPPQEEERDPVQEARRALINTLGGPEDQSWGELERRYDSAGKDDRRGIADDEVTVLREKAAAERLERGEAKEQ